MAKKPKVDPNLLCPKDLSPSDKKNLLGMLSIGVPATDACHAVGISPTRFREWMDPRCSVPGAEEFRTAALRADGMGVAQHVKILFEGKNKVLCEQHRFLLSRRRPTFFGEKAQGHVNQPLLGSSQERDSIDQIVAVLESAGVSLPENVKMVLSGDALPPEKVREVEPVAKEG